MARQHRNNNSAFTQEPRPITRVALYARVSTLNNQDPEMQLSELREYAGRRAGRSSKNLRIKVCQAAKNRARR